MAAPSTSDAADFESLSDRDLVRALQRGETAALEGLYDRYGSLVYTLALRMLSSVEEAEDLTQDVFVHFWQQAKYEPDRGSVGSYLATYTRSRALDRLRVGSNRRRILQRFQRSLLGGFRQASPPLEQVSQGDRADRIRAALQQLPAPERQVLEIAYFEGCSQSQIAARLNIPLGTVKTRSRQGLRRLRDALQSLDLI